MNGEDWMIEDSQRARVVVVVFDCWINRWIGLSDAMCMVC